VYVWTLYQCLNGKDLLGDGSELLVT